MRTLVDYQCDIIKTYNFNSMIHKAPEGYEKKFTNFIRLCTEAKSKGADSVIVAFPWVLGDDYNEVIESLSRLADAGLNLHITDRKA
jgi:sugar phosphate isomerase/epimerase